MARHLFESGIMAEFLIKGLVRGKQGELCFPEPGSVSKEEIDAISKSTPLSSHFPNGTSQFEPSI